MKTSRLLILAFLLLAAGVSLICGYTNGSAGFDFGIPVGGTKLHLDLTTTGWPALLGVPSLLFGATLLCLAFLSAIVKEVIARRSRGAEPVVADPYPPPA
ncbi:MAG TPA: hypothetical protein VL346_06165 [Acidobacteriaceae bacterium]|nr:hypothetical protein [Acidobacteriaceae bacterium]